MRPKTIILVRHGESRGNVNIHEYSKVPDYAIELTEKGIEQAKAAGRELLGEDGKFIAYYSPYFRTHRTFDNIAGVLGDKVVSSREDILLREQEWSRGIGKHADLSMEEERLALSVLYYRFPDGESNCDLYNRASIFIGDLYRDFDREDYPENALIVTHGMFMRVFLMRFLRLSVEEFELLRNPHNCQAIFLDLQENGSYALRTPLKVRDKLSHPWKYIK